MAILSRDSSLAHRSEEHTSELQSPKSTLFPYTTLFRSHHASRRLRNRMRPNLFFVGHSGKRWRSFRGIPRWRIDRKSTRLNSSHRNLHSFPTRRSSDLIMRVGAFVIACGLIFFLWAIPAKDGDPFEGFLVGA